VRIAVAAADSAAAAADVAAGAAGEVEDLAAGAAIATEMSFSKNRPL
jgi:hypothetical protein